MVHDGHVGYVGVVDNARNGNDMRVGFLRVVISHEDGMLHNSCIIDEDILRGVHE